MQSGTKLVLGIFGLAVAAGVFSWWYRFEAAHRATYFWGPQFAELIARPADATAFGLEKVGMIAGDDAFVIASTTYQRENAQDLTAASGMVHLRNSLLTDGNYRWDWPVADSIKNGDAWRWGLQFFREDQTATLLFNEDFSVVGRWNPRGDEVRVVDCEPMAETLREYFSEIGAFGAAQTTK